DYKMYEKEMEIKFTRDNGKTTCDYFLSDNRKFGSENVKDICVKFKILYNIIHEKRQKYSSFVDDKDFSYLNYWLNEHSRNATSSNNVTVKEFQMKMDSIEYTFNTVTLDKKLYDIKNEDFNNMILLSHLENEYSEIYSKIKSHTEDAKIICIRYFQDLINSYNQGIIQCPHDNTPFCKALNHFKGEYEKLFFGVYGMTEKCVDRDLLHLPKYNDVSQGNKKTTVAVSVLGPTFGTLFTFFFFYMITPFRQWIHARIGKNKETQSNIYEQNNESFLNSSDKKNINFDENPYHISYDSGVNF
ncbi:PIR Superfamily Protein, partial [Plasmodium ovale curtisi]